MMNFTIYTLLILIAKEIRVIRKIRFNSCYISRRKSVLIRESRWKN
jgi:hypothetical protein